MADAVRIEEERDLSLVTILARRGASAASIGKVIGLEIPVGRDWTGDESMVIMGSGPGVWLAHRRNAPSGWHRNLGQQLTGVASVSDQSGAYRILRVEGPRARNLLQRGAPIDLDRSQFAAGSVAITAIGRIDVIIRCLDDTPAYELAVHRSYAASFLRWSEATIAGIDS